MDNTELGSAADALLQQDKAQQVRNNITNVSGQNPDQAAQYQHLAAYVNVPVESVQQDPAAIKAQASAQRVDADNLAATAPRTTSYLTDPNNAAKSHDDVHNLAGVEAAVKALPAPRVQPPGWNDVASALPPTQPTLRDKLTDWWASVVGGPSAAQQHQAQDAAEANAILAARQSNPALRPQAGATQAQVDDLNNQAWEQSRQAVGGMSQVPQVAAERFLNAASFGLVSPNNPVKPHSWQSSTAGAVGSLAGFVAGPAKAGAAAFEAIPGAARLAPTAGEAWATGVGKAVLQQAGVLGAASGLQEAGGALLDSHTMAEGAQRVAHGAASGAAIGGIFGAAGKLLPDNTLAQWAGRAVGVSAAQDLVTGTNPLDERPLEDKLFGYGMNAVFTANGAGRSGGNWFTSNPDVRAGFNDANRAQDAMQGQQAIQALGEMATASKTRERDPAAFRQLVQDMTENGNLKDVYISAKELGDVLNQSGVSQDQLARQMPEVAAQIQEATATNGDVRIPVEDYATHIAGGPVDAALLPHLKTDVEGMTFKEAQDHMAGQQESMQATAEKISADAEKQAARDADGQGVHDDVLAQLDQLKRFNPDVNKQYAALMRSFFETQGERHGMTAREVYDMSGLNIKGTPVVDGLNQTARPTLESFNALDGGFTVENGKLMREGKEAGDLKLDLVDDGKNAPHMVVRDIRIKSPGKGTGTEALKAIMARADETGTPVALTTEAMLGKAHQKRLRAYYEGLGFVKNRGADKVPGVKEEYVRPAQASDQFNQANRGGYNPETSTLALLKAADLSTFLHESGHFFLEATTQLAARPEATDSMRADSLALLGHLGIEGTPEMAPLDRWATMSVDEKRAAHEQFAVGFEKYLMEGKAPTIELQGLFSRFRSWLVNIYKSLSNLDVKLAPEVRGIMDRMLASDEAIREAEQTRDYKKLFDNTDDSVEGRALFDRYQTLGARATDEAIADMTGRSMRDMKWASNAKDKAIRALQKDADSKRTILRQQVTREVMAEPVYQAWQFLTLRGQAGTRAEAARKAKGDPKNVDTRVDNLYTAIAKMGGLNRDEVKTKWGVDHNDMPASGVFGKPVVRKSGGLSIERMAERLTENHYLDAHDLREFEEKFDRQRGGQDQYSWEFEHSNGERPPAEELGDSNYHGKLDTKELRYMFGEDDPTVSQLIERRMTSEKTGLDPDIVAEMVGGFHDGREMIEHLLAADKPSDLINRLTDQRMLEQYGELSDAQHIEQAANEAVHNETRAKFMATGLKLLSKSPIPARQLVKAAREAAETSIAGKRVRDLRPTQYLAAEARSNKEALALAPTDPAGAVQAQRAALLNNQLFRVADAAVRDVQKQLRYLARFDKESTRAKIDVDYRDQIDALLDRYDLRKSVSGAALDKREALASFVERMAAAGMEPNVPERLLNEAQRTHYKDITVEEFGGLVDAVKSIDHLGRLKTELLDGQEKRSIEALADEAAATMAKLPQRAAESNRGLTRIGSAWLSVKSAGRSLQASLLKMEQMMDWLDGRNANGVMNRVVFRRIADAGVKEYDLQAKVKAGIDDLLHLHLNDVTKNGKQIFTADGLIDSETGLPQRFTKKEMLALAGNMGNDSNIKKLAAGEKWDEAKVWDFLHANMQKADWDFVAGMGRAMESLWPEKLAMSRRLGNTNPDKIEPRPFDTPHGRYDGWYWPMVYDPARAQDVAERGARAGDALFENVYSRANTDTGRTNTRNENYAAPILLSIDVVPRVLKDEIHDIAYREAIIDADKFIATPKVRDSIVSALSQEHYDQLRPWLQSIANDRKVDMQALKWFDAVAHGARTRATIVGLGYRVSTMLVHGTSAAMESVAEVGPVWMGKGLADFINPMQWTANRDFIFERSGEMRNRMNEVDRDIREHLREIDLRLMDPATSVAQRGTDLMKAHAYQGIAMLDMASALPTWMGAYHKAMAPEAQGGKNMSEQDAIYFADKTVRNAHGGSGAKDMAAVQRGPEFFKLFTMFYTFWNHNANRLMDTARLAGQLPETYRNGAPGEFRGDIGRVIMRTLIYTLGIQTVHHMMHPPKDGEDDSSWAAYAAKEFTASAFAGIPILRDLSAHYLTGKDYSATPAAGMVDAIGHSGKDAADAMAGREVSEKALKHTITTAGYVFALPTGQAASAGQFLYNVQQGKEHPQNVQDWFSGLMHGDLKKH